MVVWICGGRCQISDLLKIIKSQFKARLSTDQSNHLVRFKLLSISLIVFPVAWLCYTGSDSNAGIWLQTTPPSSRVI